MHRICFIINDRAGKKVNRNIELAVDKYLNHSFFKPEFHYVRQSGDGEKISKLLVAEKADFIAAVGGDGTVNEVAGPLINSDSVLVVIPTGSGNGFARHLKIPMEIRGSIELLNRRSIKKIDTGKVNGKHFLNVVGIGLDADVSNTFETLGIRGLKGYVIALQKNYFKQKPVKLRLISDFEVFDNIGIIAGVANGQQYGNRFYIAPKASFSDGMLDFYFIKKIPLLTTPFLVYDSLTKKLGNKRYYKSIRSRKFTIEHNSEYMQLDGEAMKADSILEIECVPNSLSVAVPK